MPLDDRVSQQPLPSLCLCPLLNSYLCSWPSQEAVVSTPAHGLNLTMPAQLGPAPFWGREEVSCLPLTNPNPPLWASRPKVCHTTTFLGCPVNPEEVYGCMIGPQHELRCRLVTQAIAPLTKRGQSILLAKLWCDLWPQRCSMEEDMSQISAPVAVSGCRKLDVLSAEDMVVSMLSAASTRHGQAPRSCGHHKSATQW